MRAVIQRVLDARVEVDGRTVGALDGPGLLVYLGVTHADGPDEVAWMARKIWDLRLLRDEQSASDVGAPVLVVSQFTLVRRRPQGPASHLERRRARRGLRAGVRRGLRGAATARARTVERGVFGADMRVVSTNDGPVTAGARALMPPPTVTGPTPRLAMRQTVLNWLG